MLLRLATFAVLAVLAVPALSGWGSSTKAASTQKAVRELKEENTEKLKDEQNEKAEEIENNVEEH